MEVNVNPQSTYRQTSRATNTEELEGMYQDLGYDFKINEVAYEDQIDITFRATPIDSIRIIRSTFTPSFYVMDKEDSEQGFQIFHKGEGISIVDGTEIPLSQEFATFHSGHQRMERHEITPGDTTFIMWDERALLRYVSNYLGREVTTPVDFKPRFDFSCSMGSRLKGLMDYFEKNVIPIADDLNMQLLKSNMANLFFGMVLSAQENNYRELLLTPQSPALPVYVKRARDFMNENAHQPITIEDLVAITGVSGSSLHAGFRRYLDVSPMIYLKHLRLENVHRELCKAEPGIQVSVIARKWGFVHMGRFSHDYATRYSEPPSRTLRRL